MRSIYTPHRYADSYGNVLRTLYGINDLLNRDGILAPQEQSVSNTRIVYEHFKCPLDLIPTIHVGGTNGKVTRSTR
jgi:folylpolyglutamate synthase/dihydropteroate synthase